MRGIAVLLIAFALLGASGSVATAQERVDPFGPLPQPAQTAAPTPTPTPDPSVEAQKETDRTLLFGVAGALIVLFVVIGRVITRDARKTVRAAGHDTPVQARDQGPHRHAKQAKAKARAKTKAQRAARRHNR